MKRPSDLYERIYAIVRAIPPGKVTTYGAIAAAIGIRSGSRVVGYALNHLLRSPGEPSTSSVPAHRVVNRLGQMTGRGYFYGDSMNELLRQEGVRFREPFVVDLQAHFWDPGSGPEPS